MAMWRRITKGLFALAGIAGAGLVAASCGSSAEAGLYDYNYSTKCDEWPVAVCSEDVDCYSGLIFEPGTRCIDERCLCAVDGQIMCNRIGHPPENLMRGCYFPVDCEPGEMCVPEELPPPPPPPPECTADDLSKCAGPLDERCGIATCNEGICGVEIVPGPIASQRAGDCKRSVCTAEGLVAEEEDRSDFYDDGVECTLDLCEAGNVIDAPMDGITCPDTGEGYCLAGACVQCVADSHCSPNEDCKQGWCVAQTCTDNVVSPNETDIDCGGDCTPCTSGDACMVGADCKSKVCMDNKCVLPTCDDGVKNDGETDVDCGTQCPEKPCVDGKGCATGTDCLSNVCWAGKCQAPTCIDGVQNADETGIDCGGSTCPDC